VVNAYDPTIAPIVKGKSNCPAQFGRKPGIISEPATGFIFANLTPEGNPYDASYVLPLVDKVETATNRLQKYSKNPIHSVAGDMGINDPVVRQALHERQILTVGIPKTVTPIEPNPSPEDVRGACRGYDGVVALQSQCRYERLFQHGVPAREPGP
jgi:hypothetical protein